MPPKRTSTSETPVITLDAIRQLINDGISSALKAQAAAMATLDNPNRNTGLTGTPCAEEDRVTFATSTLTDDALSWWNAYAQLIGIEQANKKMEDEFYNLVVKGIDQAKDRNRKLEDKGKLI
ncbi:hypothetical protein Tco_0861092 [Tanacetum coccineum]|uniref:Reverse transcriptase domain-containing protein n=1 Tax=Tanacetum coccineum TaxID=301880 RepID=A0ABQ5BGS8_9ASTR